MADYEIVDTFGIDGGELDGLSPQQCFVLGVEWSFVRYQADAGGAFSRPVNAANRERLSALFDRRGREYRMTFMPDDSSESWLMLEVAD